MGSFDANLSNTLPKPFDDSAFPFKVVWSSLVLSKVKAFSWMTSLNTILTLDNRSSAILPSPIFASYLEPMKNQQIISFCVVLLFLQFGLCLSLYFLCPRSPFFFWAPREGAVGFAVLPYALDLSPFTCENM